MEMFESLLDVNYGFGLLMWPLILRAMSKILIFFFVWLLLDFFCSGILLYVLLSPYLCFISILYLDFYVFGNGTSIS